MYIRFFGFGFRIGVGVNFSSFFRMGAVENVGFGLERRAGFGPYEASIASRIGEYASGSNQLEGCLRPFSSFLVRRTDIMSRIVSGDSSRDEESL